MIAANGPNQKQGKLLIVDERGAIRHAERDRLADAFRPGDLVIANDAATIPASLSGQHEPTGEPIEIRLASFVEAGDPTRFLAVVFGRGDHRTLTEDRPLPPTLAAGHRLRLGPLSAVVEGLAGHPRLARLRFTGEVGQVWAGLANHGRPIQYAHVPDPLELWDVWTGLAARPFAFEAPSAGFALDWKMMAAWHERGVELATLTHAAGISSTGDPDLDARLPFDEPYVIPAVTSAAINRVSARGGKIVAIGTTVVRAVESAATTTGLVAAGPGVASGRIGPDTELQVIDVILSGVHEPGESHFDLLRAFADEATLTNIHRSAVKWNYRNHEFGDSVLLHKQQIERNQVRPVQPPASNDRTAATTASG